MWQFQEAFTRLKEYVGQWTDNKSFAAHCYLKLGEWQLLLQETLDQTVIPQILRSSCAIFVFSLFII